MGDKTEIYAFAGRSLTFKRCNGDELHAKIGRGYIEIDPSWWSYGYEACFVPEKRDIGLGEHRPVCKGRGRTPQAALRALERRMDQTAGAIGRALGWTFEEQDDG